MADAAHDWDGVVLVGDEMLPSILDDIELPRWSIECEQRWVVKDLRRRRLMLIDTCAVGEDDMQLLRLVLGAWAVDVGMLKRRVLR